MTVNSLIEELALIVKVHPEALDAEVWAIKNPDYGESGAHFHVNYIGFDKKHKPARIKLED